MRYLQYLQAFLSWLGRSSLFPFGKSRKLKDGEICYVSGIRRCISTLIDLFILAAVLQFTHVIFLASFPQDESTFKVLEKYKMGAELEKAEKIIRNKYMYKVVLLQSMQLVFVFMYNAYMWTKFSTTIGKLLMGLKVVDESSLGAMSLSQAGKRFCGVIVSGIPLGLGILWSNFDARKRAWHDMMAKTVVVTASSLRRHKELCHTLPEPPGSGR